MAAFRWVRARKVCLDHCLRVSDALEDRLLDCIALCKETVVQTCETQCHQEAALALFHGPNRWKIARNEVI